LRRLPSDADYVAFFDDDFVPDSEWLEACARIFEIDPAVACVTGQVLIDGILGPGLSFEQGETALRDAPRRPADWRIEGYSPYGCNMAFRVSAIAGLRFDERLPLYGWLEDLDFGAQVARRRGKLVKVGAAAGVHLGVKGGRVAGSRLGYSQIANPVYLWRKGTMTGRAMLRQMARNMAANLARAARPEPFVDRRGRLRGNALALVDLARGVCRPERAGSL
jgi:GT2 family glycosyltransferase